MTITNTKAEEIKKREKKRVLCVGVALVVLKECRR